MGDEELAPNVGRARGRARGRASAMPAVGLAVDTQPQIGASINGSAASVPPTTGLEDVGAAQIGAPVDRNRYRRNDNNRQRNRGQSSRPHDITVRRSGQRDGRRGEVDALDDPETYHVVNTRPDGCVDKKANWSSNPRPGFVYGAGSLKTVRSIRAKSGDFIREGVAGTNITLVTNFAQIIANREYKTFQYQVYFHPATENRALQMRLLEQHREKLLGPNGEAYLFKSQCLSTRFKLPEESLELKSVKRFHNGNEKEVLIKLTHVAELAPEHLQCLANINVLNRQAFAKMKYVQIGRHYFNPHQSSAVAQYGLEIWPGFISSIRVHDGGLLLGLEFANKLLRNESVHEHMLHLCERGGYADRHDPDYYKKVEAVLIGTVVMTKYNTKTYRIDAMDFNRTPRSTFVRDGGAEITFADYFKETYGLDVTDLDQPLIKSRAKNRGLRVKGAKGKNAGGEVQDVLLVPELCYLTGLSTEMRKNTQVMRAISAHTKPTPDRRVTETQQHLARMRNNAEVVEMFKAWGLEVALHLLELSGRVLPPEKLTAGGDRPLSQRNGDWTFAVKDVPSARGIRLKKWLFVFCSDNPHENKLAEDLYKGLRSVCEKQGMPWLDEAIIAKASDRRAYGFTSQIEDCARDHPDTQMVVAVVPNDEESRYQAIKKICCVELGVPSQVVTLQTLERGARSGFISIVSKIALQMNIKMGGAPWVASNPMKDAMVVGYDASHDAARGRPSAAAVVFSLTPDLTVWYSRAMVQTQSQELADVLTPIFTDALKEWHGRNGVLPGRIIYYRDGVGEEHFMDSFDAMLPAPKPVLTGIGSYASCLNIGQIPAVKEHEIEQIERAFSMMAPDYHPKLTFVIVNKRCNIRFFEKSVPGSSADAGDGHALLSNPKSGTILDHDVTLPSRYDFFLVSAACGRNSCVMPVSCNVVHDEIALSPDRLQCFTFKLCHLYYNWSGTIRVPAPCLYAHKLAFLVGQTLKTEPKRNLQDKLYFL